MRQFLSFLIICSLPCALLGEEMKKGRVVTVVDGNTIEFSDDGSDDTIRVMLDGIDSPELGQEFGEDAKRHLEKLLLKKDVTVVLKRKDRKGVWLAVVLVKHKTDVRIALLKEGLAWTAERNPDPELESLRASAASSRKGLWSLENPTPPWTYRRQQTMAQAKSS